MRREHISDGWWTMPGAPDEATGLARHQEWADASHLAAEARGGTAGRIGRQQAALSFPATGRCAKGLAEAMRDICNGSARPAPRRMTSAAPTARRSPRWVRPRRDEPGAKPSRGRHRRRLRPARLCRREQARDGSRGGEVDRRRNGRMPDNVAEFRPRAGLTMALVEPFDRTPSYMREGWLNFLGLHSALNFSIASPPASQPTLRPPPLARNPPGGGRPFSVARASCRVRGQYTRGTAFTSWPPTKRRMSYGGCKWKYS